MKQITRPTGQFYRQVIRSNLIAFIVASILCCRFASSTDAAPTSGPTTTAENVGHSRQISVTRAAAPVPALKYRLLSDPAQQTDGNAALDYMMALQMVPEFVSIEADNAHSEAIGKYLELPIDQLRKVADDVDGRIVRPYTSAFHDLTIGAHRDTVDWGRPFREEGIGTLLPHLNQTQRLAKALALKARLQIARGQFEEAIESIQVGYTLSRHVEERGVLIQAMVSSGIVEIFTDVLEDFVQQPDAPNLYWALAEFPQPIVSIRNAISWERATLYGSLPSLRQTGGRDAMQPQDWQVVFETAVMLLNAAAPSDVSPEKRAVDARARFYPVAKAWLGAHGMPQERLEESSQDEILGRAAIGMYDEIIDQMEAACSLPFESAVKLLTAVDLRLKEMAFDKTGNPLMRLMPSVKRGFFRTSRIDRRLAFLGTVEAIRDHAAAHGDALPETLDALVLPAPLDPLTGKPFEYATEGKQFRITGPAPAEDPEELLSYVLTLQ